MPDGTFRYTGEGQVGDMTFARGNRAIRDHAADGKDLYLFEKTSKGCVRYLGQMVCAGYDWIDGVPGVESRALDTSKANALAAPSRAYVAVYEAGLIEFRIRNIDASIEATARSTMERSAS